MSDNLDPPDYDAIERQKWKEAQNSVALEAQERTDRIMQRVKGFMWRFGFNEKAILNKIASDTMFAAWFAKEPRRTGLHEAAAAEWIKKLRHVKDFKVLPKSGRNALKVSSDGNIESETNNKKLPGKSLDFKWKTGGKTFYAMHKYTKEGGGNQDSQYKEMIELMSRFLHCRNRDVVLLIIVDGPYYQEMNQKRLLRLKENQKESPPKSYALAIREIPTILNEYQRNDYE